MEAYLWEGEPHFKEEEEKIMHGKLHFPRNFKPNFVLAKMQNKNRALTLCVLFLPKPPSKKLKDQTMTISVFGYHQDVRISRKRPKAGPGWCITENVSYGTGGRGGHKACFF